MRAALSVTATDRRRNQPQSGPRHRGVRPRGFQRLAWHSQANASTPQTTLRHGEIPSRNLDGDGFMQELSLQKQRRVGAGLDCLPQSPENPSRIPMFPQCWGYAKTHDVVTVHHTSAPLRADAARPEMAQTPEGARHHPNDAHRDAMAGSSQCSIRARRDATHRQRRRRPQRSPASSRASLLKTTQHATTSAPDRNQMKSRCMRWDKTEKPYRENRTDANGSQATPALEVGECRQTERGEYPMQARDQFETRTSAGRDSDALMGAEPLPAPPRHSRLRVPMMRRAVGGRACTAGVPPELISPDECLHGEGVPRCQDKPRWFDTPSRAETTRDRIVGFGRVSVA